MNTTTSQDIVLAVRSGELSEVLALLETGVGRQRPADLGLGLAMASFLGYRKIARELVRYGAPLNLPAGLADASPLAMAIKGGQKKTTRLLISLGAQIPPGLDTKLSADELAEAQGIARRRAAAGKAKQLAADAPGDPVRRPPAITAPPPAVRAQAPLAHSSTSATPGPAPSAPRPAAPPAANRNVTPPAARTLAALDFTPPPPSPAAPPAATVLQLQPPPPAARRSRGGVVEEIEMTSCYGVDTSVLEGDLMRWNGGGDEYASPKKNERLNMPELDLNKKR